MRRGFFYLSILLCCQLVSIGQTNPIDTLFTINKTPYSSQEFVKLYENQMFLDKNKKTLSPKEALDLFILFQLKLTEAKKNKIDTLPEVKKKSQIYSDLAFNSYLYPTVISEEKINEAFERIQYFIKARHILVKINKRANPKDTLSAYLEAQTIYKDLLDGKRFEKIARNQSDDQSVRFNRGELGYFTAFDMDYQFETAAFQLKIGEYSKPVRTQFGYHIIQIIEKIPNPGKVKIRHLLLEFTAKGDQNRKIRLKIDSLHQLLIAGNNFEHLAEKYSDDKISSLSGGKLPWFGLFEIHPEIEKAAFQLKEANEISKPVKTDFGYHILQLVDRKDYSSLTECRKDIKNMIAKDSRSKQTTSELITKIKQNYHFKENRELLSNFYSILDYAYADLWEPLFQIGAKKYSQENFADYLSQQPSKDIYENFKEYINRIYVNFSNNSILAFYKKQLLKNNFNLKTQLKNYENKVLVLSITKQKIWLPVKNDNNGLMVFFQKNRRQYNKNVDFESIKNKVASDYQIYLKEIWGNQLRKSYKVKISQSTLNKIDQ